ncbi:MAG: M36 family metallopeptidase [Pyrinomonadaceae bacterium]|nr:M36 family metallopeptidase [Pyrinomonadaceae bacterium]
MFALDAVRRYRNAILPILALCLITAIFLLPSRIETTSAAVARDDDASVPENYDIRLDKDKAGLLERFREESGKTASAIADIREALARGETNLRGRTGSLKVEYNFDLQIPEVITPDVWSAEISFLTQPSAGKRPEILRSFLRANEELFGLDRTRIDELTVAVDYTNPDGNLSYVKLKQAIAGVPVFRGEVTAGFTKRGEIVRIINNLVPGVDTENIARDFGDAREALNAVYADLKRVPTLDDLEVNAAASTDSRIVFGRGDWATTAEKIYFPTEPGVLRPAWQVLVWFPQDAYLIVIDAGTKTLLFRKSISESQTEPATYQVYTAPNAYLKLHDSPAPLTPGPLDPGTGQQGSILGRTSLTFIGNEGDLSFNNLGWMTDGTSLTDGNAVEAGIDRDGTNGVDAPQPGEPYRVFTSLWNPPPGDPPPGDEPLNPQAQRGAVIQMFYALNRWHDELYKRGFTEQAGNFQHLNFGRGGSDGDRVSAEAQDSSSTNGANFSTPPDGGRPRLQMNIWTGPTPDRDGAADSQVVLHEMSHGLSSRLHGNATGLGSNMARGMGEGWSDWYPLVLLAQNDDSENGTHAVGGYITHQIFSGFTANYYYGIRRFPIARISSLGPNGKPHNPLTFRYLNSDCNTLIGTTTSNPPPNSAFPRGPIGVTQCDQIHNAGEVWSALLWEVLGVLVDRLGFTTGSRDTLQVVTDGMKLSPFNPTLIQSRDAIIAAAAAISQQHAADVREGFRRRGLGFSARIVSSSPANVVEAFDLPNVNFTDPFTIDDTPGNGDGNPTPGESVLLNIPVQNVTGAPVSNVSVRVNGGPAFNYGTIANGQTVTNAIPYVIPLGPACIYTREFSIVVSSDLGTQTPVVRTITLFPFPPPAFSNTAPIDLPGGQPTTTTGPSAPYPSTINVSGLTGNYRLRVTLNGFRHDWHQDVDLLLVGPGGQKFIILSDVGGANTEALPPRTFAIADSAANPMTTAPFIDGAEYRPTNTGASDPFPSPAPAAPYENPAPAGSATLASVFGTSGASLNGTWSLYGVDDANTDPGQITGGWKLTFEPQFAASLLCTPIPGDRMPDFDGDGRTDISIYRPSAGEWWYLRSSDGGNYAVQFGSASDVIVPADYEGDRKTDMAFYRDGEWFVMRSNDFTYYSFPFGVATDIPAPGDYDGDGKSDAAVFRPTTGEWFIQRSTGGVAISNFGVSGDRPVPADYDGDGKTDIAIFRPNSGEWWLNRSTAGVIAVTSGTATDMTVVGDYSGDGKADIAYFRPTTGEWYIIRTSDLSYYSVPFGAAGDIPAPGDYDGDSKIDPAVFRPSDTNWYVQRSTAGILIRQFGIASDKPVPSAYVR